MSTVFEEINSGKPVTCGLQKVPAFMKTKNRVDRTDIVSASENESNAGSPAFSKSGPPKFELQMGWKWVVENQLGCNNLLIDDCDTNQSVYVYGCKISVLQIQVSSLVVSCKSVMWDWLYVGKVNNISIDKCPKMGVVFKDVVAAWEVANCNGVEVHCQGSAPTISVVNTAGFQLSLSKDALDASITTAKSSEINVLVPGSEAGGDWVCFDSFISCHI